MANSNCNSVPTEGFTLPYRQVEEASLQILTLSRAINRICCNLVNEYDAIEHEPLQDQLLLIAETVRSMAALSQQCLQEKAEVQS